MNKQPPDDRLTQAHNTSNATTQNAETKPEIVDSPRNGRTRLKGLPSTEPHLTNPHTQGIMTVKAVENCNHTPYPLLTFPKAT